MLSASHRDGGGRGKGVWQGRRKLLEVQERRTTVPSSCSRRDRMEGNGDKKQQNSVLPSRATGSPCHLLLLDQGAAGAWEY